jgi:hypothetical protein
MKTYRNLFFVLVSLVLAACDSNSEDELVGNWVRMGEFGGSGRSGAATFVIDNKGYVCGGYNGYKTPRKDVKVITIDERGIGAWDNVLDSMPKGRMRAVGFSVNGKGYVGTGWDGDETIMKDFWEYDPDPAKVGHAWRQVADLPSQAPARYDALAFVLNGQAYVGTGYTSGADKEYLLDFYKFIPPANDADLGSWEKVQSTGNKRSGAVAFVLDGYAYVCTGTNASGNVYNFQRFNGTVWQELRKMRSYVDDDDFDDEYGENLMRTRAVAFTLKGNGTYEKGYIALGNKQTTWEYEPPIYNETGALISGDIWTQRTPFISTRLGAFALSFPGRGRNGDNLVFIGAGEQGNYLEDQWHFFPEDEHTTNDD